MSGIALVNKVCDCGDFLMILTVSLAGTLKVYIHNRIENCSNKLQFNKM